ncbi:MAG TPA: RodZ domain-containing protein [Pararobbsia sp.]|nr:RodZ domain-containing protein [Pararobbsia sp.]
MSNKPHPASQDAIAADEERLAANDANEAHVADETTPGALTSDADDEATSGAALVHDAPVAATARAAAPVPVADGPLTSPGAVGARLAQLRESRRWSIEDVSTRLKVPPNKLRAIEAGDLSMLPDMTFTLGVIRAYAKLLGVDAAPLTGALRQSTGPIEQDLSMPASRGGGLPRAGKASSMSLSGPPKRRPWIWGIGAVVLAVVVLLLYRNGTEPSVWLAKLKPMTAPVLGASNAGAASAAPGADAPAEASGDAPGAASDTQAPADTSANAAPASATTGTTAAAQPSAAVASSPTVQTPTSPAAQTLAAVAGSSPGATNAPAASAATKAAAAAPASEAPEPVDGQQSIHISVTGDSWVSVREAGGKEVLSGLLHAGDARDAVGKPPLQFVIGNNKGIDSLEVNGAPVDPSKYANAKGNVARFTLP